MQFFEWFGLRPAKAICYSGFRDGQQPGGPYPSYEQVKEDLLLLRKNWNYLRLYDCDDHAAMVLQVIAQEQLDFQVMLGAYIEAEVNNDNCPWGGVYEVEQLERNKRANEQKIERLIHWANAHPKVVFSLSVGNEACVNWTDHLVSVDRVIAFAQEVKAHTPQPVTFCENYLPWLEHLRPLAEVLDFVSIHTYPVWEYKTVEEALHFTQENFKAVASLYPNKPIVITEAGWATRSNGRGILPERVNEHYQKRYYDQIMQWVDEKQLLMFYFEAFDEAWKGSDDPLEPEKHWGLYFSDRTPKLALRS
ncbi:MAG: glycosyl hydrolase [Rhodothermia bacterium]|nr:glycosyl hydrolase [Rhodothermia bacterium]